MYLSAGHGGVGEARQGLARDQLPYRYCPRTTTFTGLGRHIAPAVPHRGTTRDGPGGGTRPGRRGGGPTLRRRCVHRRRRPCGHAGDRRRGVRRAQERGRASGLGHQPDEDGAAHQLLRHSHPGRANGAGHRDRHALAVRRRERSTHPRRDRRHGLPRHSGRRGARRPLLFGHTRRVGSAPTTTDAGRPVGALARRPGVLSVHEA